MFARPIAILASLLLASLSGAQASEPVPPGVGVRMTLLGPTFVDPQGMTLYQSSGRAYGSGPVNERCSDKPLTTVRTFEIGPDQYTVPRLPESQRSCAERFPPFVAAADAKPVGDWTIVTRDNGVTQWVYKGRALHTSTMDVAPGQISSHSLSVRISHSFGWRIATAPFDAPPGIGYRLTSRGLALATKEGRPLYFDVAGGDAARKGEASGDWAPLRAPVAAEGGRYPDWAIATDSHGQRVWAWKGNLLYTYGPDLDDQKNDGLGRDIASTFGSKYAEQPIPGWRLALLTTPSEPPPGVRVMAMRKTAYSPYLKVFGTAEGKPVYVATCFYSRSENTGCDNVGDSPVLWSGFCGGDAHCKDWEPLLAAPDAKPSEDGVWGVAAMNPAHPYRPLAEGEKGLRVWTWQGRFVFTYAKDKPSQVANFYTTGHLRTGFDVTAIPAFLTPESDIRISRSGNAPIKGAQLSVTPAKVATP